jgi:peptidoglycan/xylan/chitin deacetylase (PgdA/CDA1 family)
MYLVKTPSIIKKMFSSFVWDIPTKEKILYLTFDDGPHERATPFVLDELKKHHAKATFFCIGKNVVQYPAIYQRILDEGHAAGNHTQHHLNGWKTKTNEYINDIREAANIIQSDLFRPPYGKIKRSQSSKVSSESFSIIMWDVLSGDFDLNVSKEKCLQYVLNNAIGGSIIVFHDSTKAFEKLQYVLPKVLGYFTEKGYQFQAIKKAKVKTPARV